MLNLKDQKFKSGKLFMTAAIHERSDTDIEFAKFVIESLRKHLKGNWGDITEDDKRLNDLAITETHHNRVFSAYNFKGNEDDRIWIITEYDRTYTTILFPTDY